MTELRDILAGWTLGLATAFALWVLVVHMVPLSSDEQFGVALVLGAVFPWIGLRTAGCFQRQG